MTHIIQIQKRNILKALGEIFPKDCEFDVAYNRALDEIVIEGLDGEGNELLQSEIKKGIRALHERENKNKRDDEMWRALSAVVRKWNKNAELDREIEGEQSESSGQSRRR